MKTEAFFRFVRVKGAAWLLGSFCTIVLLGGLFAALSFAADFERARTFDFCLSAKCVAHAKEIYAGAVDIILATGTVAVWLATVGGVFVALLNYLSSSGALAFGNHVSHTSIFNEFMHSEIAKRDKLGVGCVDIFQLYAKIFSHSSIGTMSVSKEYSLALEEISREIERSNQSSTSRNAEEFRFKDHQSRMIVALAKVHIRLERLPRIDFYEVEAQAISLIDAVNRVFCSSADIAPRPKGRYF